MEATLCHVPLRKCLQRGGTKNTTEKKKHYRQKKTMCKGPEVEEHLAYSKNSKKANMNAVAITKGINKICTW